MIWKIIVSISIFIVIGLCVYNIISFIRKWKAIPKNWFDLLLGIIVWSTAIAALIFIFIKYVT